MTMFEFKPDEALGQVRAVDTTKVEVEAADIDHLRRAQVNRLVMLESSRAGERLVGMIRRVTRVPLKRSSSVEDGDESEIASNGDDEFAGQGECNMVSISLLGTHMDMLGKKANVFSRTLHTVPDINAMCFPLEGDRLTQFMQGVAHAQVAGSNSTLLLGQYTLAENADAYLNGDLLFQRHAAIVGSTGAGKSYTVARIIEQAAQLPNCNAILFDIHGEYESLARENIVRRYKIAGPSDVGKDKGISEGILFLPFWLLGYQSISSLFVDRSSNNAPNQNMAVSSAIISAKKALLEAKERTDILDVFTIDSPVPFNYKDVLAELKELNTKRIMRNNREVNGPFNGQFDRMIPRLEAKINDRRLGFLFQCGIESLEMEWLDSIVVSLMEGSKGHPDKKGIKVVDFSEVPSDILPLIVSMVAQLVLSVQQWTPVEHRHPIALFCDEAHRYIPNEAESDSEGGVSVDIFKRIAKEGRKHGVGLVVISQRPADVHRTVLSQCNNFIAMRLTNSQDQSVIRKLFPDDLGNFADDLPVLDTGEALVVGDASILPTRIRVKKPCCEPKSATVNFWSEWQTSKRREYTTGAIDNWRKQALPPDDEGRE